MIKFFTTTSALFLAFLISYPAQATQMEKASFAGGCFWCMEPPFEKLDGVKTVTSGYTGGDKVNPTYSEVSSGQTGHVEAVEILFDPSVIDYQTLLDVFWKQINPTDDQGQFVDRGRQYRSAIFYHDDSQQRAAQQSLQALDKSGRFERPIVTEVLPAKSFYPAEDYHQDYYKANPVRYKFYRYRSGRDSFLERTWQKPEKSTNTSSRFESFQKPNPTELKRQLSSLQYKVTQDEGTEQPFNNEYWNNKAEGIYVDIVSGEPLFSSIDKYKSGTGWPSFTKPINSAFIVEREDRKLFTTRIEVRSQYAGSHLGHVFDDGPKPTGLRYCLNSASLRFIPKEKLKDEGYGEYLGQFE